MKVIETKLPGALIIEPKVFGDLRALEMAHGITPVQTYLSILELFALIGTW